MKAKILFTWPSFIISLAAIIFFSALIMIFGSSGQGAYVKPILVSSGQTIQKIISITPVRIKIPNAKVNALLERVGLTKQGAIDVPKGGINAARYKLGPKPGQTGNAIIVGHYGTWKNGQGSVFDNLQKLKKGDKIFVEDDKGKSITFIVTKTQRYDPSAVAPEVFISSDGKAHLNIITCGGTRNKITKHYPNRLVVFTDRI